MSRIDNVYVKAKRIMINESSKIAIMSDCHRGDGSYADDFEKNKNLYFAALTRYYLDDFTYIELGDGDELWEVRCMCDIFETHGEVFWRISQFLEKDRFYMLYGNHDIVKSKAKKLEYYDERKQCMCPLPFEAMEGIVLQKDNMEALLLHGHQADFFNDKLWRVGRFLVRHIWRPLELVGVKDPTSANSNEKRRTKVEQILAKWADDNNKIIIAGHTHKPYMPNPGEGKYFNDGCCVNTSGITAIEIENGCISLVKWRYKTKTDGTVYVGKVLQKGPVPFESYF